MDFREEYKKDMESVSPDKETIDRMKAAVLAKIAAGEGEPGIPGEKKKPLPLRNIAYIGGAVAACAVIAVSAATILPNINKNNDMISTGSAASAAEAADTVGSSSTDAGDMNGFDSAANADTLLPNYDIDECATAEATYDIAAATSDVADDSAMDAGAGEITPDNKNETLPDNSISADNFPQDDPGADTEPSYPTKDNSDSGIWGEYTMEPNYEDDGKNPEAGYDTAEATSDTVGFTADSTTEVGMTCEDGITFETEDEAYDETEEVPPAREITIVFSGNEWITFRGERYQPIKSAAGTGEQLQAYDPVSKEHYTVVENGDVIYVYKGEAYLGAYRRK